MIIFVKKRQRWWSDHCKSNWFFSEICLEISTKLAIFLQTVFWRSSPQIIIPAKIQWNWPIFLRTFLDNPMKLDFFSANYHKPWLSWFPNQMFLGLCHLFLSQKHSWDRNAQSWSTGRTSMIVGGYHKWATCTCRHKMEGRGWGGTFHEVWHWQMQWVGLSSLVPKAGGEDILISSSSAM